MRWVVCVALLLALVPRAFAGDYDILRGAQPVGPATFTRWSGFYAGGQYGWSDANADFSNATSGPVAFALRVTTLELQDSPSTWPVLGTADHGSSAFGAFAGYNTQWQDLILGLEANYQHIWSRSRPRTIQSHASSRRGAIPTRSASPAAAR